jgi:hypothetical protein
MRSRGYHRCAFDLSDPPGSNDFSTEDEESPSVGPVTRQRLLETVTD